MDIAWEILTCPEMDIIWYCIRHCLGSGLYFKIPHNIHKNITDLKFK